MYSRYINRFFLLQVYIKDNKTSATTNPTQPTPPIQQNADISSSTNPTSSTVPTNHQPITQNIIQIAKSQQSLEQVPFYTVQIPTIVANSNIIAKTQKDLLESTKVTQLSQNQIAYNLNLLNTTNIRNMQPKTEMLNNVVINSNGEVINISNMGDFEAILNQGSNVIKTKHHKSKKQKESRIEHQIPEDNVVKIDLTGSEVTSMYDLGKYDKLPHIKSTQSQNKYAYSLKVDEKTQNPTVIFPNSEYNQNFNNFSTSNSVFTQANVNIINSSHSTPHGNVVCNSLGSLEASTVNINTLRNVENSTVILNQNVPDVPQTTYTNVISSVSSNVFSNNNNNNVQNTVPNESTDSKANIPVIENNSTQNPSSNSQQKSHICEICSRGFKRREHLYQHMKLHTGFRPYICEHCNKAFMRKEHVIRHSTLHSGQKNFTCNICDKSFSRNDNLLKHKKTHEKQASYVCEICQKQFVMKHYYNAHKLTHGDKCFVSAVWNMLKT